MVIKVYVTTVSASSAIKKNQQKVIDFLQSKKLDYVEVDISSSAEIRTFMTDKIQAALQNDDKPKVPQIFSDEDYLGDYEKFFEAVEGDVWKDFFKIPKDEEQEGEKQEEKKDEESEMTQETEEN